MTWVRRDRSGQLHVEPVPRPTPLADNYSADTCDDLAVGVTPEGDVDVALEPSPEAELKPFTAVRIDPAAGTAQVVQPFGAQAEVRGCAAPVVLPDGRIAAACTRVDVEQGFERVFYTLSTDGLSWTTPVVLRPEGGALQRVMGLAAEPDDGSAADRRRRRHRRPPQLRAARHEGRGSLSRESAGSPRPGRSKHGTPGPWLDTVLGRLVERNAAPASR